MTRFDAFLLLFEPANGWHDEAAARAAFLAFARDRLAAAGAEPARLDAEGTATPRTRIVGHGRAGDCQGPFITRPDAIEDTATGERTPLAAPPALPDDATDAQWCDAWRAVKAAWEAGEREPALHAADRLVAWYRRRDAVQASGLTAPGRTMPPDMASWIHHHGAEASSIIQAETDDEAAERVLRGGDRPTYFGSDDLNRIEIRWGSDPAKGDPELVCDRCGDVLCDVEHGDTLAVLAGVATDHRCPAC